MEQQKLFYNICSDLWSFSKTLIRANQGHSIPVDVELERATPPGILYHGSAVKFEESIDREGLFRSVYRRVYEVCKVLQGSS